MKSGVKYGCLIPKTAFDWNDSLIRSERVLVPPTPFFRCLPFFPTPGFLQEERPPPDEALSGGKGVLLYILIAKNIK